MKRTSILFGAANAAGLISYLVLVVDAHHLAVMEKRNYYDFGDGFEFGAADPADGGHELCLAPGRACSMGQDS